MDLNRHRMLLSLAVHQYGAEWTYNATSSALARLGDAVGLAAPSPAVGTGAGSSPFDTIYPWSRIRRCNISSGVVVAYEGDAAFKLDGTNGDVMVKIPKFWYKSTDNSGTSKRQYWIADGPADGFAVHPAFIRGGVTLDYIYVGRYATSGTTNAQTSKSGVAHLDNITRSAFRGADGSTGARAKGTGWFQWGVAIWKAIQLLYLVEFADWNSQSKIGRGRVDATTVINTGATDEMVYHTGRQSGTDGLTAVQYRWIENLWGTEWNFVDGYNINGAIEYFCLEPENFAEDTSTNYTQLGYSRSTTNDSYITRLGFDSNYPWLQSATAVSGSESTYIPDKHYYSSGWRAPIVGGAWNSGTPAGLFCYMPPLATPVVGAGVGSRLMYLPSA